MVRPPGAWAQLGEWAAYYARLGYRVLPLVPRGKAPLYLPEVGFRRGKDDASSDPKRLEEAWERVPEANIGLVPGERVLVLDLDEPGLDGALLRVWPEMERAPRSLTGSGGSHVWLRLPEGVDLPARVRAVKGVALDLRGMGRTYLVVPPSVHPGGGRYRWTVPLRREEELPLLPGWLLGLLREGGRVESPVGRAGFLPQGSPGGGQARRYALGELYRRCQRMAATPEGSRHGELVRHAVALWGWVRAGVLLPWEVREALRDAALRSGLPDREVDGVLQWVERTSPVREWWGGDGE